MHALLPAGEGDTLPPGFKGGAEARAHVLLPESGGEALLPEDRGEVLPPEPKR